MNKNKSYSYFYAEKKNYAQITKIDLILAAKNRKRFFKFFRIEIIELKRTSQPKNTNKLKQNNIS
ncbi:hypothetical protein BpHYR1_026446 [Brachionus plicatilis]|uniref:Uncharacterized protein n=1 Tax=Brachionus plicatilis TaxID=10195 RepID=A0A3M7S8G5_BRAPC|nr:hypothetical protein BpHYR1_026446 [Brachionus plicatilis]